KGFAVILPTPWKSDDILYNAALFIQDGEIKNIITKYELPDTGVFDDKRVFTPGALDDPIEFNGHKVGLMICEDLWHPTVSNYLKNQGAEALIVVNGSPYYTEINAHRTKQASSRVEETGLPLLYVNQVGSQDELVFDGRSFTMNEKGKIEKQLPAFKEHIGVLKNHKNVPSLSKEEEIYSALVLGVRDYIEKNGFLGVLIGLSGGIDSALTGAIAVDAIGTEKVQCVMMPSKYTSEDSLEDAKECASLLGVDYDIIPIKQGVEAMDETLINHLDPLKNSLAFENIQSRLRGLILMALSNANGKMLLSTGNKSEMAVGYATLYGDMCGGFNALKDVYKTQVYALAKWRNKQGNVTPERIITKAPSAELKDNQTDQDSLPPYDVLDNILIDLIEHNKAPEDINYDTETVWKVWKLLDRAEYKRRQAPPGTKITAKAFGRDRRYPITNGYFDTKS
ncbi:MAG: NAD+ synthase, partial [Pseudomonadota bacterium]